MRLFVQHKHTVRCLEIFSFREADKRSRKTREQRLTDNTMTDRAGVDIKARRLTDLTALTFRHIGKNDKRFSRGYFVGHFLIQFIINNPSVNIKAY